MNREIRSNSVISFVAEEFQTVQLRRSEAFHSKLYYFFLLRYYLMYALIYMTDSRAPRGVEQLTGHVEPPHDMRDTWTVRQEFRNMRTRTRLPTLGMTLDLSL